MRVVSISARIPSMMKGNRWLGWFGWLALASAGCQLPRQSNAVGQSPGPDMAEPDLVEFDEPAPDGPAAPSPLFEPALAVVPTKAPLPAVVCTIAPGSAPATLVVAVGQELRFDNHDTICHRFFSSSGPNAFDLGLLLPGVASTLRFAHPGTVQVYCSLHEHVPVVIRVTAAPETP